MGVLIDSLWNVINTYSSMDFSDGDYELGSKYRAFGIHFYIILISSLCSNSFFFFLIFKLCYLSEGTLNPLKATWYFAQKES